MHARRRARNVILCGLLAAVACRPAAPAFGAASTVAAAHADFPTIAVDATGAAYVVWAQRAPDSTLDVMLARAERGGGFGAPVRVNDRPGDLRASKEEPPQVAVGPGGEVYVAWVGDTSRGRAARTDVGIRVARSLDHGATFSPSVAVVQGSRAHLLVEQFHDLAVGPDGALYISWLDLHAYAEWAAAKDSARAHGDSVASRLGPDPEYALFWVARSADRGATFAPPALLDTTTCICCRTAIAAGPDSAAHALWRHVFAGNVRDFVTARAPGGTVAFAAPSRVHDDHWVIDGCPDIGPGLAIDAHGALHVAWYTGSERGPGLYYASSNDRGAHFSAPVRLAGARAPAEVKLASFGGETWLAWEDKRLQSTMVRVARAGEPEGVAIATGALPAIAAGGGTLAVAWTKDGAVQVSRTP